MKKHKHIRQYLTNHLFGDFFLVSALLLEFAVIINQLVSSSASNYIYAFAFSLAIAFLAIKTKVHKGYAKISLLIAVTAFVSLVLIGKYVSSDQITMEAIMSLAFAIIFNLLSLKYYSGLQTNSKYGYIISPKVHLLGTAHPSNSLSSQVAMQQAYSLSTGAKVGYTPNKTRDIESSRH